MTDIVESKGINSYVSLRSFLVLFVVALIFKFALFGPISRRIGADEPAHATFDTRWKGYTAEEAIGVLNSYGEEGRRLYRLLELTVDLAFPLIYAPMFAIAIAGAFGAKKALRPLVVLPFIGALFDYGENFSIVTMINRFPNVQGIVGVASFCTRMKCALLALSFVLAIFSGIALLAKGGRRSRGTRN
jgi:hypothetical protein